MILKDMIAFLIVPCMFQLPGGGVHAAQVEDVVTTALQVMLTASSTRSETGFISSSSLINDETPANTCVALADPDV